MPCVISVNDYILFTYQQNITQCYFVQSSEKTYKYLFSVKKHKKKPPSCEES